jgi:NRPS condensation-like uncharacterized protein
MQPLSTLEEYMLLDDSPAYPMVMLGMFRFSGHLERSVLERALFETLGRYPLLTSIARRKGCKGWEWVDAGLGHEYIRWHEGVEKLFPLMPFDIRLRPGFFLAINRTEGGTDLLFHFHHSCCDGRTAFVFVGDFILAYAALLGPAPGKRMRRNADNEPQAPLDRVKGVQWQELAGIVRAFFMQCAHAGQFLLRAPIPLIPHRPVSADGPLPPDYPAWCTLFFDKTETSRLVAAARRRGVMRNDLIARDLFLAVGDWKKRHAPASARDWLRIIMPVDLRRTDESPRLTGNRASIIFLDQRYGNLNDSERLLGDILGETALIRTARLGFTFLRLISLARVFPWLLEFCMKQEKCQGTCVMTNLGRVFNLLRVPREDGRVVLGDAVLESIEGIAATRKFISGGFAVLDYGHRLSVTLNYDTRVLTKIQADDLLATYGSFMRRSMEEAR